MFFLFIIILQNVHVVRSGLDVKIFVLPNTWAGLTEGTGTWLSDGLISDTTSFTSPEVSGVVLDVFKEESTEVSAGAMALSPDRVVGGVRFRPVDRLEDAASGSIVGA